MRTSTVGQGKSNAVSSRESVTACDGDTEAKAVAQPADVYGPMHARDTAVSLQLSCGELMRHTVTPHLPSAGLPLTLQQGARIARSANLRVNRLMDEFLDKVDSLAGLTPYFQNLVRAKRIADAQRLADHLQKTCFNSATLQVWLGALPAVLGRWAEVAKAWASASEATWQTYFDAGKVLEICAPATSIELYCRAAAMGENNCLASERAAICMADHNETERARVTLEKIFSQRNLSRDGLRVLADLQVDAGTYALAQQNYERCLRAGGLLQELCCGLAVVYASGTDVQKGAKLVQVGLRRANLSSRQLHHLVTAAAFLNRKDLLQSCQHRVVAAFDTPLEGLWIDLALAMQRCNDLTAALAVAKGLCDLLPSTVLGWRLHAELQSALGNSVEAARAWGHVAGLRASDVEVQLSHGYALLLVPNGALGAQQAFDRALALSPRCIAAIQGHLVAAEANAEAPEATRWLWLLHEVQPDDLLIARRFVVAALASETLVDEARQVLARLGKNASSRADVVCILEQAAKRASQPTHAWLKRLFEQTLQEPVVRQALERLSLSTAGTGTLTRQLTSVPLPETYPTPSPQLAVAFEHDGRRVAGCEVGKTHDGRSAVLTDTGELVWAPWGSCPSQRPPGAVSTLRVGQCFRPASMLTDKLNQLLTRPVAGNLTAQDFTKMLGQHGECFVVGGAVRDILGGRADEFRDLDLATTLAPNLTSLLGSHLARGLKGMPGRPAGIVSPYTSEFFGLVRFGEIRKGELNGALDVQSLRTWGAYQPRRSVFGARGPVLPLAFGADLHTDSSYRCFTVNSLFWCLRSGLIFDPTGHGVKDLRARRLRLCDEVFVTQNEMLGWRYLKMRAMGFSAADGLKKQIGRHFAHFLGLSDAVNWRARTLRRVDLGAHNAADWRAKCQALLTEDGLDMVSHALWPQT